MPLYINYSTGSAPTPYSGSNFGNIYTAPENIRPVGEYGPSEDTGWYAGIDYPAGGYSLYIYTTGSDFEFSRINSTNDSLTAPPTDGINIFPGNTNPALTQIQVGEGVASASLDLIRRANKGRVVLNQPNQSTSGIYTITNATLVSGIGQNWTRLTVTTDSTSGTGYTTGGGSGTIGLSKFEAPKFRIYTPQDDTALLNIYNNVEGTTYATSTEVKDAVEDNDDQYIDGEPSRDGMVLYYDFSNPATYGGSGNTVRDQSGEGLDGELVNSPSFNSSPPYFTGFTSNQYIGVTDTNWQNVIPVGNAERTILIAFRTPNAFSANYYHALHYGDPTQDEAYGFAVWTNSGNGGIGNSNADGVLANHTWQGTFYADFALSLNTDYVGVIRYRDTDRPRSSMWINGSFKTIGFGQGKTQDYSIDTGTSTAPRIGNRISNAIEPLGTNGRIYSILFYDRFLSDDECSSIGGIVADRHNISF